MSQVRVDALRSLLTIVDDAIAAAEPREIAALSREKRQLLAELESLSTAAEGSPIDELVRRREERLAAAAVRASADSGGKQRGRKRSS